MGWRKRYSDLHKYDEYVTKAEETSFLDNYKNKMIQLDPRRTMLVICHTDNTVDKTDLRQEHLSQGSQSKLKETKYKLEDFVKESKLREFYRSL